MRATCCEPEVDMVVSHGPTNIAQLAPVIGDVRSHLPDPIRELGNVTLSTVPVRVYND